MEELLITEQELEYFTDVPSTLREEAVSMKPTMSFEEAVKACNGITLEEFSRRWKESIRKFISNP